MTDTCRFSAGLSTAVDSLGRHSMTGATRSMSSGTGVGGGGSSSGASRQPQLLTPADVAPIAKVHLAHLPGRGAAGGVDSDRSMPMPVFHTT